MEKLKNWLKEIQSQIQFDKTLHLLVGMLITGVGGTFINPLVCTLSVLFIAFLKEFMDCNKVGHECSLDDAIYTLAGGFLGLIPIVWALTT